MAKAIKFAALAIGAVALIATGVGAVALGGIAGTLTVAGVSTSTLLLVSGGLSVAATLLQKAPKVTASQTERLTASVDPRAFRKTWLGQTAGPVDVRYEEWSGKDQELCDWIIALASHAIDGVDEVWFDTEMAWSATTGVVGKYVGYFAIPNLILEGTPQNAFSFGSGTWKASSARMTGCAYARFRFKVTGNGKKAESPFSSGIPNRITIIGRGAKLYDPRRDSTIPGGSGPMRWDDQSTWRYTADDGVVIGENLPLQILRVVLGWRIRNPVNGVMKLATGSGVPGRRISFASFQVAANLADELVNRSAGGNEPRYHGAGIISEGDDQKTVLDMLCAACCSRFRDTGGKLALSVSHNDLASAAIDDGLNDDDVVGAFTWDPDPSLEATPNIVRGKYVDPTAASLYQLIDYPEVSLPSPDGQDRYMSLDLGVVESPSHAQRVAKQVLQRRQYARQFTAPFDIRAWKYGVGDVLPFTFAPLGLTRGLFRVKEQELGQGGTCNMVLTFETPVFYQWDASDVLPVQGAEAIVYDSRNNPLILAIDEAAGTAFWNGVTGEGKPADNATNSGDPTSPLGSTTVGEFERQLAAAREQLAYIDGTTIPTINDAVADAGERIDAEKKAASDALADAVKLLDDSDAKINERIDSVAADGGYDDTAVYAEVRRVDRAAVSGDQALGQRIDSAITSFQDVDKVISGRVDEVAITASNADRAVADLSTNVNTSFQGVNLALSSYDQRISALSTDAQGYAGRTSLLETRIGNSGAYATSNANFAAWPDGAATPSQWRVWTSGTFTREGSQFQTGAYMVGQAVPNGNDAGLVTDLFVTKGYWVIEVSVWCSAGTFQGAGANIDNVQPLNFSTTPDNEGVIGIGGPGVRNWSFLVKSDYVGQVGFYAMGNWSGFGATTAKTIHWLKCGARPATDGEIKAQKASVDLPQVFARVKQTEDTLADLPNRYAAAQRTAALEAQVNGDGDSRLLARANSNATAIADAKVGAVVGSVTTLSAQVLNRKGNLLPNGSGEGGINNGKPGSWNAGGGVWGFYTSPVWGPELVVSNTNAPIISVDSPIIPCSGGAWYTASADLLIFSDAPDPFCYVDTVFILASGAYVYSNNGRVMHGQRDFGNPGTRDASWVAALAPADAVSMFMRGVFARNDGGTHRVLGIREAKIEQGQGPYSPYSQEATIQSAGAQLTVAMGALAGLDGRTSVFWSVTGTTPDGSTRIQLSKADGSPGQFYIGANLLVDGNAIFNGSVTIKALDRSTMTATTSGSVAGSYGGAGAPAIQYIPNLGADMFIRAGGSVYMTFTGAIASTTDAAGSTYPSIEILNAVDNSALASVRLPTVGFGPGGRLDNYTIRVLNVWGDVTIRWRVAVRATSNTWNIVQNPALSVYWTAL
jgi:hypothetical protein